MLRLTAHEDDDLAVISAQMQDAIIKIADFSFSKKRREFALVANRFAWDALPNKQRRRSGLHFASVVSVQRAGFANTGRDTILSLLALTFETRDAPSGIVILSFSAGHSIRLEVECLDAVMADMGPAWSTDFLPDHKA
jgi:Protein of unknown function (DUF2948)